MKKKTELHILWLHWKSEDLTSVKVESKCEEMIQFCGEFEMKWKAEVGTSLGLLFLAQDYAWFISALMPKS